MPPSMHTTQLSYKASDAQCLGLWHLLKQAARTREHLAVMLSQNMLYMYTQEAEGAAVCFCFLGMVAGGSGSETGI